MGPERKFRRGLLALLTVSVVGVAGAAGFNAYKTHRHDHQARDSKKDSYYNTNDPDQTYLMGLRESGL